MCHSVDDVDDVDDVQDCLAEGFGIGGPLFSETVLSCKLCHKDFDVFAEAPSLWRSVRLVAKASYIKI